MNQILNIAQNTADDPFYIVGGTLQHDAPCYVARQADHELFDELVHGQFCYVLTARQMGKSSLMLRTAMRLRDAGVGVAVLDLTGIGQNLSAEQWYGGLLLQIGLRLALENELSEFWQTQLLLGPLQRWMQAVRTLVLPQYPGGLVIFIDEIDAVRSLPFATDEFFASIRECYNLRSEDLALERLTFCLLGVATPADLIRDTRTTPFNIGRRIELHDFTAEEAAPLARGLGDANAALLKRILHWTNGHPFLTQRLCQVIAGTPEAATASGVDRLCQELFCTQRAQERDDNLLFVRDRLLRGEQDVAGLLSLYADVRRKRKVVDNPANPLISSLHLAGVVRAQGERLRVRNRIYETVFDQDWVAANLPAAERRRQRAAYRRGVWQASVAAAFVLALLAALAWAWLPRGAPAERRLTYTYLPLAHNAVASDLSGAVFAPDGRRVVMVQVTEGVSRLWLYRFETPAPELLPGTEEARYPFWSPDGRSIGFFAQRKLKRLEINGGVITELCDAPAGTGGAWGSAGVIIFAPQFSGAGLAQVVETGGPVRALTHLDTARYETGHNHPRFLPDGRHFLFFAQAGQPEQRGIRLGVLDTEQTSFLTRADAKAEYSTTGYLLLLRGRKILAQPFDPARLTLSGAPIVVAEQVYYEPPLRYADLAVSGDQWLLYRAGGNTHSQLVWLDRAGQFVAAVEPAGDYRSLQLSPAGDEALLDRNDPQVETSDIWKFDLRHGTQTRLTANPATESYPIWSPDGRQAAFVSNRDGVWSIYRTDGTREELLLRGDQQLLLTSDWSHDGQTIVYRRARAQSGLDLEVLSLTGMRQLQPWLATRFDETYGMLSPDGRWLAYQSNDTGRLEIAVQSFPTPGRKVTVSQGGGMFPRWRRDGRELYYIAPDDRLMALPVTTGARFAAGTPVPLFSVGGFGRRINRYVYDVSADGQRFLLLRPLEDATRRSLTVVQNWTELLKPQGQ